MKANDFYYAPGCCLACSKQYKGCLCFQCKCRKCEHYDGSGYGRACTMAEYLSEESKRAYYERKEQAERNKKYPITTQKTIFGNYLRKNTPQFLAKENRKRVRK